MADNLGDTTGITDGALGASAAIGTLTAGIGSAVSGLGDYIGQLGNLGNALKGTGTLTQGAANSIAVLSTALLDSTKAFQGWGAAAGMAGSGFEKMSAPLHFMIDGAEKAAKAAEKMSTSYSAAHGGVISETLQKTAEGARAVANKMNEMIAVMDGAQAMQNDYIRMMLASGQATQLFTAAGNDLSRLPGILKNISTQTKDLQINFGLTAADATAVYQGMGQIPGMLNEITTSTGGGTEAMSAWTAAIRLAHGAGMDLGKMLAQQNLLHENLTKTTDSETQKGQQSLEFLARQAELSDKLHIPLEKTTGFIDRMAEKFKFLGDNTRGASQVLLEMGSRLMSTGLGYGPAIAQTEDMIDGLTKMTTAQRAFMSSQTGGPGGLQGAIQIQHEMRSPEGIAKAMGQAQEMIKKRLGPLVTEEEATKSQGAASKQFQQTKMLQSLLGMGKGSDVEATNIINAMAAKPGGLKSDEAKKVIDANMAKGGKVEALNKTDLQPILAELTSLKQYGGLELLAVSKSYFGITNDKAKKLMEQQGADAQKESGEAGKATKTGVDISAQTTTNGIKQIWDRLGGITTAVKSRAEQPGGEFTTAPDAAQQTAAQNHKLGEMIKQRNANPTSASSLGTATPASQRVQRAAVSASASKAGTTSASSSSTQPRAAASQNKQPIVVNANIYVDGKLIQTQKSQQVAQDLGNHQSGPGY